MDRLLRAFERIRWQKRSGYLKRGHYILKAERLRPTYVTAFVLLIGSLFLAPLLNLHSSYAISKTWDGGCGANTNWSCANNWSDDIVPAAGDTVTFNATSTNNSTVDALFNATETITTININSGYTGTITLGTTLHVTTSWVQGAGTFTAAAQTLDLNGSFTLSAGTFTASSGTTTLAGAMTISGSPTFNANGGTFTFDAGAGDTLSCNNVSFNLVSFNNTGGKIVNSNCSLPLGANPTIANTVTLNGTLSGSGTLTISAGTFTLNAGATLSGFSGLVGNGAITNSGATTNLSNYTTVDMNAAFILSSGTFTAPSGVMTAASTFTISGGTFNANGGTVSFDGGSGATLSCNNVTFNLVTIAHTAGAKTVSSNCSLPLGNNPALGSGSGTVTLNGTLSGSGSMTTASSLTLNAGAALSGFSGLIGTTGTITVSGATINLGSYTTVDLNAFAISSGTFTAPTGVMTVASTFTISSGTFNTNGGTVTFDGVSATLSCNNVTFNLVNIAHISGTKTISSNCSLPLGANPSLGTGGAVTLNGTLSGSGTLSAPGSLTLITGAVLQGFTGLATSTGGGGTLTVSGATLDLSNYSPVTIGAFTLSSGSFTAPAGTMVVRGNFNLSGTGVFNHNNGTLEFSGTGVSNTLTCNHAVFNLVVFTHSAGTKTVSSDCSLPLGNNPTMGVGILGTIALNGTLSGSGTLTSQSSLNINTGGVLSGFNGLVAVTSFRVTDATVDLSFYNPVDLGAGMHIFSGGTVVAPTGTMSVFAEFTVDSGATFTNSGGTVVLDGGDQTISGIGVTFNNLTKLSGGTLIILASNTVVVDGALVLNDSFALGGSLSGNGTLSQSDGTLTLLNGFSLTGYSGMVVHNLKVDGGTANFGGYTTLDVNGDLTLIKPGILTAPSGNFTVAGNIDTSSHEGHLRLPGAAGNYAGTPDSPAVSVTGDLDLRVEAALDSWHSGASQNLIVKYGAPSDREYFIRVNPDGTILFNGSLSGTVTNYSALSTAAISAANGSTLWVRVTRNATSGDVTFFTSTDGTTWIQLGTVVNPGAGLLFDSAATLTIGADNSGLTPAAGKFYHAQIRNNILDNGTGIVFDADFTNHADGTTSFTESSTNNATVTINGSDAHLYSDGAGTFSANGGTAVLDGGDQTIFGSTTFHNLTKSVSSAATLTLPAGGTQTIQGALTLKGISGHVLGLVSSVPGSQWQIDAQGARSLSYLGVKDSRNVNGAILVACNSTDSGNNSGWSFNPSSCTASAGSIASKKTSSSSSEDNANGSAEESGSASESPSTVSVSPSGVPGAIVASAGGGKVGWVWWLLGIFLLLGFVFILIVSRRRKSTGVDALQPTSTVYEPGQRGDHE